MKNAKKLLLISCALMLLMVSVATTTVASASEIESNSISIDSPSAILMDAYTGEIIYEKNSTEHRPVASMVKIMTLLLSFDALREGELSIDEKITVSENAASMGGSQAYLDPHSEYVVSDLIKAAIIASANDACVALAERLGGSVEGFVVKMNEKAAQLGMQDTNFVNCTGLPAPNQYSCAADAAKMFRALIRHKKYFEYSTVYTFDFTHPSGRTTMLTNTNKLVKFYEGCDGGKTGFTNEAMYCLSATAKRGDTRLISVITGAETSKKRNAEICKLFDYGFANYQTKQVIFRDVALSERYFNDRSREKSIEVAPLHNGYFFSKKGSDVELNYLVEYNNEISLPIKRGDKIGKIVVMNGDKEVAKSLLIALQDMNERTFKDVVDDMVSEW